MVNRVCTNKTHINGIPCLNNNFFGSVDSKRVQTAVERSKDRNGVQCLDREPAVQCPWCLRKSSQRSRFHSGFVYVGAVAKLQRGGKTGHASSVAGLEELDLLDTSLSLWQNVLRLNLNKIKV